MKKFYSLLVALLFATSINAQVQTEVISAGVFKVTYGASNDYSFYDPGFEVPTFYIHTWIPAAENTTGNGFDDSWGNSTVTMNWDAVANAYVGTINLNTKVFTNSNNTVPQGTTVNKVGMVFKDLQNGANRQSADTFANGPTTLTALAVSNSDLKAKSSVVAGKLYTSFKGNVNLEVYEMSGKLVKSFTASGNAVDLNVTKTGTYLVKITNGTSKEVVKFVK